MEVDARNLLIQNIFSKGKFIVPNFQREYDWDEENLSEFINDINDSEEANYFIGHMVFSGKFNGNEFTIIDGQQRITSIMIVLCAIRDRFLELKEEDLASAIHNKFIFTVDLNNKQYPILENRMPYPVLQARVLLLPKDRDNTVLPQKKGEKRIISAYLQIMELISKYDVPKLCNLRDKILNTEAIFVAATDLADASTVFMTLNATGKDLSALDLVKNYLFSKYPKTPGLDEPNDSWKVIIGNTSESLKDNEKDRFLNNSFASRYRKVSDRSIYKEIIRELNKTTNVGESAKRFLKELKEDSYFYNKITKPQISDWQKTDYPIYESLNAIVSIFKISVANSFLIALLRDYQKKEISKKMLLLILNSIERFHFVNNAICSRRSSGYDSLYSKNARLLFEAKNRNDKHRVIRELKKTLEEKIPSQSDFLIYFDKKLYFSEKDNKQKALTQYVLTKIERTRNKNAVLINTSIEHIYPEKSQGKWEKLDNTNLVKNIGNLVLLDSGLNSTIGNSPYLQKKKIVIQKSNIISTKDVFIKNDIWGGDEISKRNNELKDILYFDIWKER